MSEAFTYTQEDLHNALDEGYDTGYAEGVKDGKEEMLDKCQTKMKELAVKVESAKDDINTIGEELDNFDMDI